MTDDARPSRIHPVEVTALGFPIAALTLAGWAGLGPDAASARYTLGVGVRILPGALVLGVVLQAYVLLLRRQPLRPYLRRVASVGWLLGWLRLWVATLLLSYGYFWLKLSVPLLREAGLDAALWRLDALLHFGVSPNELLVGWFAGSPLTDWVDRWYALWLASVVWCIAFFAASADDPLRRSVVLSCCLLWALGACTYLLLPAVGPVYAFPEVWEPLRGSMPRAEEAQATLWQNYQGVIAARTGEPGPFRHTLGVAALPSLHVAFHVLFCLWAFRAQRLLLPVFAAMAALTTVGAVLTGWHYAVDAYAGAALAWAAYRLALLLEPTDPIGNAASHAPQAAGGGAQRAAGERSPDRSAAGERSSA